MYRTLPALVAALTLACGDKGDEPVDAPADADADTDADADSDTDTDADTDTDTDVDTAPTADSGTPSTDTGPFVDLFDEGGPAATLQGGVTWTVDFGKDLEAKGAEDCAYTRTYVDGVEDRSAPWLCPDCQTMWRVEVTMDDPDSLACYRALVDDPKAEPDPLEYVGWSADGRFFRTSVENLGLGEQGTVTDDGKGGYTFANTFTDDDGEAGYTFVVDGSFTTGEDPAADPWHGYAPSASACGWPRSGLPNYDGDYTADVGDTLPDGHFLDACGDAVRLHDFAGRYLVVDVSAADCPPCQDMAEAEPGFVEDMADEGLSVEVVTLMAPSLSAVLDPTPQSVLEDWTDTFDLHSPVLGDRGYGYAVFAPAIGAANFAYPTWLLVSPDLEVLEMGAGYGPTTFVEIGSSIRSHAGE